MIVHRTDSIFRALLAVSALWLSSCASASPKASQPGTKIAAKEKVVRVDLMPMSSGELCGNAWDDNQNGVIEEGCGIALGNLSVIAAWNEASVDVDLFLVDPKGEVSGSGFETASGFTKVVECPSEGGPCPSPPYELVSLREGRTELEGPHVVVLRLTRLGGTRPPVLVQLGVQGRSRTLAYLVELSELDSEVRFQVELP